MQFQENMSQLNYKKNQMICDDRGITITHTSLGFSCRSSQTYGCMFLELDFFGNQSHDK